MSGAVAPFILIGHVASSGVSGCGFQSVSAGAGSGLSIVSSGVVKTSPSVVLVLSAEPMLGGFSLTTLVFLKSFSVMIV